MMLGCYWTGMQLHRIIHQEIGTFYNIWSIKSDFQTLNQIKSCHVIVCNSLSLSKGSRGVAAGANPSLVSGRGQGTPWTSRQLIAGPSLMSNVGFSINQIKSGILSHSSSTTWSFLFISFMFSGYIVYFNTSSRLKMGLFIEEVRNDPCGLSSVYKVLCFEVSNFFLEHFAVKQKLWHFWHFPSIFD